jgi:hypothetical protein
MEFHQKLTFFGLAGGWDDETLLPGIGVIEQNHFFAELPAGIPACCIGFPVDQGIEIPDHELVTTGSRLFSYAGASGQEEQEQQSGKTGYAGFR